MNKKNTENDLDIEIIVVHRGNQSYLKDALRCAREAGNKVVLIGDESNAKDIGWIDFRNCRSNQYDHFLRVYEHMSSNPYKFELICFERYFLTYEYMQKHNLEDCVMMDSDVCLFKKVTKAIFRGADLAVSIPEQKSQYSMSASAHFSYWKKEVLKEMLDFLVLSYEECLPEIYEKWNWHKESGVPGGICDMTLLYLFSRQYKGKVLNTDLELKPLLFDQIMSDWNNHGKKFLTMKNGHTKNVYKNDVGEMCYQTVERKFFPVLYIHAQGGDKRYIFAVSRKRTGSVWMEMGNIKYWMNRLYEKVMRMIGIEKRFNWK